MLVVGNKALPQHESWLWIEEQLRDLIPGLQVFFFKMDTCLEEAGDRLVFSVEQGIPRYQLKIDGGWHDLNSFGIVYYNHPKIDDQLIEMEPAAYRQYVHAQHLTLRKAMWVLANKTGVVWLNDPTSASNAEQKIVQLQVACEVGLNVPDTIATYDPDSVRRFHEQHPGVIIKSLAIVPIPNLMMSTHVVTVQEMDRIDQVRVAPSIFQEQVRKAFELRITVVGDEIFVAVIDSQSDPGTAIDWRARPSRDGSHPVKFSIGALPPDVENKIREFMRRMGLRYGAIDMIVTPEGEYVFLEVNPSGQWSFVQKATGMPIAEAIAHLFLA